MNRSTLTATLLLAAGTTMAGALPAQQLDRSKPPVAGPRPAVAAPKVVKATLPNGLQVWTVTQRELPTVNASLIIRAGAANDASSPGMAQVTASLLDEGTARRSSLEFARAVEFIGASLFAGAGDEQTQVSLQTLRKHADSAFALMGELVTQPAFRADELERERKSRLQSLRQQNDQPGIIASQLFSRTVYGMEHPYGHPSNGTLASIRGLTRQDVTGFYSRYYVPNNAVLIVVGDVTPAEASALATRAFSGWRRGTVPKDAEIVPARPAAKKTAILLVDKPGAAQSEIRIGHPGVSRMSPDFYALQVLNAALGGQFASRINMNLRETKGFTYGARSGFNAARGDGAFVASAGVFTGKTDSSLVEFFRELRDVREGRPMTQAEVDFAKASLIQAYPRRIETNAGVASSLAEIAFFRLPDAELTGYLAKLEAVKPADVTRVAQKYLSPESSVVVVVGDVQKIQPGITALGIGPVTVVDPEGRPVSN